MSLITPRLFCASALVSFSATVSVSGRTEAGGGLRGPPQSAVVRKNFRYRHRSHSAQLWGAVSPVVLVAVVIFGAGLGNRRRSWRSLDRPRPRCRSRSVVAFSLAAVTPLSANSPLWRNGRCGDRSAVAVDAL